MADYHHAADRYARQYGIPPRLFRALIGQESGWNARARSPVGAMGLTQLMPGTARGLGVNPNNPLGALEGGAKYLSKMYQAFHSWPLALAAYNAGPAAVRKYGGVPPYEETKHYVDTILGRAHTAMGKTQAPRAANVFELGSDVNATQTGPLDPHTMGMENILARSVGSRVAHVLENPIQMPGTMTGGGTPQSSQALPASGPWKKYVNVAPTADRAGAKTSNLLIEFAGELGKKVRTRLTIGTGTNHNQFVAGSNRQSAHWVGHAVDIPASGNKLRMLGYHALILAGMSPGEAAHARHTGGLFNVGRYQIIFDSYIGGNHYNHIHIGLR